MKQTSKKKSMIGENLFILKTIFSVAPVYAGSFILFNIFSGFMQFINGVYLIRTIANKIQAGEVLESIIVTLLILTLLNIVFLLMTSFFDALFTPRAIIKLERHVETTLLHKSTSIRVSLFDDPSFYDGYVLSMTEMGKKTYEVLNTFAKLVKSISTIVLIINLILAVDPFSILLVAASLIISALGGRRANALLFKRKNELLPLGRRVEYADRLFYMRDYAKEIRMNKLSGMLIDDYKSVTSKVRSVISKYAAKIMLFSHLEDTSTIFIDVIYVTSLVLRLVLKGLITVGDFVGMINSAWSLTNNVSDIVRAINELNDHSIYINKYRIFTMTPNEPDTGTQLPEFLAGPLSFHDVSFRYTQEAKDALKNVMLEIKPREKVAIVGYNASGKSTLIKLLLRLYEPQYGVIQSNGTHIAEYALHPYRDGFGVVFQDFKLYEMSLAENVAMGELTQSQTSRVEDALSTVRLFSETGEKVHLSRYVGREFDENGYLLSGGERQKVALARILYSSRACIVLDEPSAALDPESEYYFNKLISEKLSDKTVIIISHRLSTTRMMDKVLMMDSGNIIESGTHQELMDQNGRYAEMYRLQSVRYGV